MSAAGLRGRAVLLAALLAAGLSAEVVEGRVTDGRAPLEGVRVHPDRPRQVVPVPVPETTTGPDGRFRLEVEPGDRVLVLEKAGWRRDLVPRVEWSRPMILRPAPDFRREPVLVVRLEVAGVEPRLGDPELRAFCFGREAGRSSAAAYFYEASKGGLLLEEGRLMHLRVPGGMPTEDRKEALAREVIRALAGEDLRPFDRVDNRTGALRPDGKPDHLWIIAPGPPGSVTAVPEQIHAGCLMIPLSGGRSGPWPVVFLTEEAPLGNLVHEALHAMGEHRVDDLYRDCGQPGTAGIWDLMDAGQYRGWDAHHPAAGPWREDLGYSPSPPGPWVRTRLWYQGRFAGTVRTVPAGTRTWTGWIAPMARAPGLDPQRVVVADPAGKGRFWEFWVSRPWGFEQGRVGGRWGPGHEGLLVARVDPARLGRPGGKAPVQVLDAHRGTPEPPQPRLPCGRHELDDAAYNLGPGEASRGRDGALSWQLLDRDDAGRIKLAIHWMARGAKR